MLLNMSLSNSCAVIIVYYIFSFLVHYIIFLIYFSMLYVFFACYKDFIGKGSVTLGFGMSMRILFFFDYYYCYSYAVSFIKSFRLKSPKIGLLVHLEFYRKFLTLTLFAH